MPYTELILLLKSHFEKATGWGDSSNWTNQDFIKLSELLKENTGATLSHVTLKRIWGKVKYDSLPNTYTLNALARFIGFDDWRAFISENQKNAETLTSTPAKEEGKTSTSNKKPSPVFLMVILLGITIAIVIVLAAKHYFEQTGVNYSFNSKVIVASGLPNSVVFNYDASAAPVDSVFIQQSWDKKRQVKVSKNSHYHTSVYYFPDFYQAKLIVNNKIVKEHELLIKSNGWLPLVAQQPVPVYFTPNDAIKNGKMEISKASLAAKNIAMQPNPPKIWYTNVADFGDINSDDFTFETSLRSDFSEGSAACSQTRIYLLCKGTVIWIPLCAKGCISAIDLYFTKFYASGSENDLSAFGVDFAKFVKVKIMAKNGKAQIFINDHLAYTVPKYIIRSRIIGIAYRFEGTGAVDYARLSNGVVNYDEEF